MFPYPEDIGIIIKPKLDDFSFESNFFNTKFDKTIITIYGLPSTGKGVLSRAIAPLLGLPVFDTGSMYRVLTYFFDLENLEVSKDALTKFQENLELKLEGGRVVAWLYGNMVLDHQIRNPNIDRKMGEYAKQPVVRAVVNKLIADFVLKSSFVTDGRGAFDGYLLQAEQLGYKVIRVLLQAEQNERVRRRFIDYLALERGNKLDASVVENLWKKCEEIVRYRDDEEVLKDQNLGLGMISEDSGVLDTTNLTIEQVVNSVLAWLVEQSI